MDGKPQEWDVANLRAEPNMVADVGGNPTLIACSKYSAGVMRALRSSPSYDFEILGLNLEQPCRIKSHGADRVPFASDFNYTEQTTC